MKISSLCSALFSWLIEFVINVQSLKIDKFVTLAHIFAIKYGEKNKIYIVRKLRTEKIIKFDWFLRDNNSVWSDDWNHTPKRIYVLSTTKKEEKLKNSSF